MIGDATSNNVLEPVAGLTQTERVLDIFIAPSKTFTDILRDASWWLPFVLAVIMSIAAAFVIDKQVGYDTVVQNTIHDSPKQEEKMAQLEPKQRAAQLHVMSLSYKYSSYASPVFVLIASAIGALVLWASFNFGFGAKTTFGQMFALWMYASLPRLLAGILMTLMLFFGGNAEAFNLKNPVGTNLAFYLPDAAPWLKTLLTSFDLIGLWVLFLLVIGTSIVAKVKRSQVAMVVVGWWVLFLVVSVGFTAAMS